jgi:invasion protein IalB
MIAALYRLRASAVGLISLAVTCSLASAEEAAPKLTFSPWAKTCVAEAGGKRTCTIASVGKLDSGLPAVAAAVVERDGDNKILRVTLPLGMSIQPGTRAIVDQGQPMNAPYTGCVSDGCRADHHAGEELISRLKTGRGLTVQGINGSGQPISLVVPLTDFAKAYASAGTLQRGEQSNAQAAAPPTGQEPRLIFSPWTKFCLKGQDANAKTVCFTGKDGRVESGMPVVAAVLIEPENEPKKVLRVTLPLGMSMQAGTRVIVDQGQPLTGPYVICFNNGCMADYEASSELIDKLKRGQGLVIQGINNAGSPISLVVPLADFAKAYNGPPTDPKVFEAQQKQLQEELTKRAQEARLKSEGQRVLPTAQTPERPAAPTMPLNPLGQTAVNASRRVALVIGNSAYASVGSLANPQLDASAIANVLRRVGFQSVRLEYDLGREKLINALRSFAREADSADWALVYFAGHGMEINGTNYVIPVDAKLEVDRDVDYEAVSLNQIMGTVEGARKLRLILLDACRDNPFVRSMRRTLGTRSVGRGLARVEPEGGMVVAYAAKHGEVALDGTSGSNSPFVTALLRHLPTPGMEINKVFRLVRDDVLASTGRKQEPFVYGSLPGEDFFFVAGR